MRDAFLPVVAQLGFAAQITLERHGFYPRGGGIVHAIIEPRREPAELALMERGSIRAITAQALLEVGRYLDADVAVDHYLADQILVPLALSAGGAFTTLPLSSHARTNLAIIQHFLPVSTETEELAPNRWHLRLHPPSERNRKLHQ